MEFCGFKTALIVSEGKLFDEIEDIFDIVDDEKLPKGWSMSASGISGASGFYLEFEIEHLPTQHELDEVAKYINEINE